MVRLAVLAWLFVAACSAPRRVTASAAPNPNSVLSELIAFDAPGAVSAHVVSSAGGERLVTPEIPVAADGRGQIAVLGLAAATNYAHVVEATYSDGSKVDSEATSVTTEALPDSVSSYAFSVTPQSGAPQSGYYLVSGSGPAALVFDQSGELRWYRLFEQTTLETKMQYDNTFTTYVGTETGAQAVGGPYVRYTPDGAEVSRTTATSPDETENPAQTLYTDSHELLITREADGSERFHLFGVALKTNPTAAWHELLRQTADGTVELRWKSWTNHDAAEGLESAGAALDIDHSNALAIDPTDGNYVASFRNFDALIKIDYQTGNEIWQLGGTKNQFTILNDPLNGFWGQHSVRVLPNGNLLIFDNGLHHSPLESRAVEYAINAQQKTATMVWQFRHAPPLSTALVGSVERLASGHTLVAFALVGLVDEVDESGAVVWEAQFTNAGQAQMTYRIRRQASLYELDAP